MRLVKCLRAGSSAFSPVLGDRGQQQHQPNQITVKSRGDDRSKAEGSSQNIACNRRSLKPVLRTLASVHMLLGRNEEEGDSQEANPPGAQRGQGRAHKCRDRPEMGVLIHPWKGA